MIVLAAVAALTAAPAFAATNLVTNGSFETGNFSGFSQFGNTGFTGVAGNFFGVNPTDGSFQAYFGPIGSEGGISQDIATMAGKSYTVSFDVANFGGGGTAIDVAFAGTSLISAVDQPGYGYTHETFTVAATGSTSALSFAFQQNPSYYLLDNISVTSNAPEPATWALMIGGFGLVGASLRRRSAALAA